jgi:phosphatidylglycerophosphate synthase
MGKLATFFQVLTVLTGLADRYFRAMLGPTLFMWLDALFTVALWLAAVFTVVSGCQYLIHGMRMLNAATAAESDEHESPLLR